MTNDAAPAADKPPPKRRWFQFSLRTLLVFVLSASIGMSWLAVRLQRAKRQKEAVEAIVKSGGIVRYDYQYDASGNEIRGAKLPGAVWLRKCLGDDFFTTVVGVDFDGPVWQPASGWDLGGFGRRNVTDADLLHLKSLSQLRSLDLDSTEVTDAGIEHLKGLNRLESLNLDGTEVTDAGIEHLQGLTELQELNLRATRVTDAGLVHLKGLSRLEYLDLSWTEVTDAGMKHLEGLNRLRELLLRYNLVTDAGLEDLRKVLPKLVIQLETVSSLTP